MNKPTAAMGNNSYVILDLDKGNIEEWLKVQGLTKQGLLMGAFDHFSQSSLADRFTQLSRNWSPVRTVIVQSKHNLARQVCEALDLHMCCSDAHGAVWNPPLGAF